MTWRSGLLLPLVTVLVGLLSVVSATRCNTCPYNGCSQNRANYGVCRRAYYQRYSYRVVYQDTVQRSSQYTTSCGRWWRYRRRCSRTRYWQETVTAYRTEYRRRLQCSEYCCSGWYTTSNNPRICEPRCSGGCQNGGTCIDTNRCVCPIQWRGTNCQDHNADCICHNGGTCVHPNVCQCTPNWTGPSCETAVCTGGCLNGGLCVEPDVCNCSTGWTGTNCETDINECTNNTSGCDHNCTNIPGGYFCDCQDGFQLDNNSHTCNDINECNTTDNGGCHQICTNTPGGYNCSCNDGFTMLGENDTCVAKPLVMKILDNPGVAAVSGVTASVIVASLVVCVLVAVVMKLRAPFCRKAAIASGKTQEAEPTPEDYGGFEMSSNPAYGGVEFTKSKSQPESSQPAGDDDEDDVAKGNVYVSTEEEPTYENFHVLY